MSPKYAQPNSQEFQFVSKGLPDSPLTGVTVLVEAVQQLSLARDMESITQVVRDAARNLTGADGATFVLRRGDNCFYAEENAIAPLWKNQVFPMEHCVSGWVMRNSQTAVIPDIYADARLPHEAYHPTFVKSMVMVPIRKASPIGAIGNYWANNYHPTATEVHLLEALANTTAVAIENVRVYHELEQRVQDRMLELEALNKELETFSYSVSHDLKAPLRSINGFSQALSESAQGKLDEEEQGYLRIMCDNTKRMGSLIDALLKLAHLSRTELCYQDVNLSQIAEAVIKNFRIQEPHREVDVTIQHDIFATGDLQLLRVVLENLLGNAWKYSSKKAESHIELGVMQENSKVVYFIRDNGAGFEMSQATNLFGAFQRFHSPSEFPGTGIGLATVARIIARHHGKIWAESEQEQGTTFYFTLG